MHGFLTLEYKNIWKTIKKHFKISRLKYARAYLRNGRYAPGTYKVKKFVQKQFFRKHLFILTKNRDVKLT
jgi:hypothetical protein